MDTAACAVGRLEPGGPWIGFAPSLDDGYDLVIEGEETRRAAGPADLLALAVVYFEDSLAEPPEELAATHGDIGTLVRHVADAPGTPAPTRARLADAVDAIDDGLAVDVVIARLQAALGDGLDARTHLTRRVAQAASSGVGDLGQTADGA